MSIDQALAACWESLSPRQYDVITGRFGIEKHSKPKTLAALGTRYGITRERVRQIEVAALAHVRTQLNANRDCKVLVDRARKYLAAQGGVVAADALLTELQKLAGDLTANKLQLIARATGSCMLHEEDDAWRSFYYLDAAARDAAIAFVKGWVAQLDARKEHALTGQYKKLLTEHLKSTTVTAKQADQYLAITKLLHVSPYGDIGLAAWPEIKPVTVRDQIYLVLKKQAQPLHFGGIAKAINDAKVAARPALAATVHNELIKDERFVLVGRGIYALAEHGYAPGNAREVIQRVLTRHGSLRPRDIILAVQKERFFKPNTILVNLQNKDFFLRRPDGAYEVREA